MIKHNIFILNFRILYEILNEIKENLFFNFIEYEDEQRLMKDNYPNIKNCLIISKTNQENIVNLGLCEKNLLILRELPLSIKQLIELINIKLIKLRFNHKSQINMKGYVLNLNSKFFSKDDLSLKLTEKEIEVILYLSEGKTKHDVLDLQKNIWGYSPGTETHTVETHIYRLRKKISDKFNDVDFILSHQNGYYIE